MGQEEELLRIAKKLEKMVARKNTVRLQSLGHGPRPREARASPGFQGGDVLAGRVRDSRTRGRSGWCRAQGPLGTLAEHLEVGVCVAQDARGILRVPEARLVHVPLDV